MATICRYTCKKGTTCCFDCDKRPDGKRCEYACTKECWLRTGGKRPKMRELS